MPIVSVLPGHRVYIVLRQYCFDQIRSDILFGRNYVIVIYWFNLVNFSYVFKVYIFMPPVVYTVSKNEPTLASCSFVKHGLILIIFGKQHRYTFRNYAHILLSLSFHVYLLYLLFSRTLLRYVRLMTWAARLSSVCLSSVTLLHRLELFGNIFAPHNSSGTQTVCVKILGKNAKGF